MTSSGVVTRWEVAKWVMRLKKHGDPWKLSSLRSAVQLRPCHRKHAAAATSSAASIAVSDADACGGFLTSASTDGAVCGPLAVAFGT